MRYECVCFFEGEKKYPKCDLHPCERPVARLMINSTTGSMSDGGGAKCHVGQGPFWVTVVSGKTRPDN